MVKKISNDSVKEVTVKKVKDIEPVISAPTIKEPEAIDLSKLKDDIVNELKPVEQPKKARKKREKKSPIKLGQQTNESQIISTSEKIATGKSNGFYVGIGIGILIGTLGIYYLYTRYKESKLNNSSEETLIKELELEGIKDIGNKRKYT